MSFAGISLAGAGLVAVLGYLLGSIPFGIIITRLAGAGDLRSIGSGNIGATNVLRTGRKGLAAATLVGDLLKGTAAVLIAMRLGPPYGMVAGMAAFLGHLFPIWLGLRGGKGVATYLGVLLGVDWMIALAFAAIWLSVAFVTRYSSLAALIAASASPVLLYLSEAPRAALAFAVMSAFVVLKHHENIRRLLSGSETRIGQKA